MGTVTQYNLANVQSALGGSNPISMSEYYRGGAYVPTTRTVTNYEPNSTGYNPTNQEYTYSWFTQYWPNAGAPQTGYYISVYWAGVRVYYGYPRKEYFGSVTIGAYTYARNAMAYWFYDEYGSWLYTFYYVYRTTTSTVSINTGVPSSGSISISQLYGAANP